MDPEKLLLQKLQFIAETINQHGVELSGVLAFDYVNYRGEKSQRRAKIRRISYEKTDFHEKQWIAEGLDCDKDQIRSFAVKDMEYLRVEP